MPYGIEVENKTEDEAEVTIYGYITDQKWYDEDVTPADFKKTMDKLKNKKTVRVLINSGGGGVFAGLAIHNILKNHPANTIGVVQGIAASTASWILQACKNRIVPKNGFVMIHNPMSGAWGDAGELRKTADFLDKVKDSIVINYAERTKVKESEIRSMMDEETWMTGEEAVVFGFADQIDESTALNCISDGQKVTVNGQEIDVSKYRAFPKIENRTPKAEPEKVEPIDYSRYENQILVNTNVSLMKGVRQ
jgi:ATP-dependent Clp endopeptidase proteolytic subunit ClpP